MAQNPRNTVLANLLLVVLFIAVMIFTAFHEEYLPTISVSFWILLLGGLALLIWLSNSISTKRFVSLILGIFIIEYIKETIGIRSGIWTYHGTNGSYNFGVWAWVMGGVTVYVLSTKVIIRLVRKLRLYPPKWVNPIILILIALLIPLTLGKYWSGAGILFFSFYILILIISIYAAIKMDFPIFIGIVISAWIVSNISEYIGSIRSGIWTFTHNPIYPPFFLVFGCWPLEILAQYLLSAFWANEPLDKDTF